VNAVFRVQTAVIIGFRSTTASTAELGACCRTTRSRFPILGERLGITRERVRQIAQQLGMTSGRQRQEQRALHQRMPAWQERKDYRELIAKCKKFGYTVIPSRVDNLWG
jgi:hypothetical protein